MIAYDLLKEHKAVLASLSRTGISADDIRHLAMFEDYLNMKCAGDKVNYIVATLSARYHISQVTVWKVIARMKREVL